MADRTVTVSLRADISNYISGMTRASGVTGLLQGVTQSLLTGQGALALVAGGAVVGGFAAAVSAASEFESAMSGVSAATMASSSTLDGLRDAAMQAGADTAYSATEAADAITEMAKAGVSAKDIVGGGLTGALNLAAAGQLDVADAAEIAATALSVFQLSGSQMPHVADLLAAGAGKAQGSVSDLSAALNQSSLVAKNTGLSIEDTTGALALFASNGLLGSDAGTSFKTMLMSLNPRSEQAATLMDQLGLRAYDAQGNFVGLQTYAGQLQEGLAGLSQEQRNAALQTIFGSDAVRAASILYDAGSAGVATWTANVNDAGYAAEQAAKLQDNLKGDLEKLGGAWDTLMISLGSGSQGAFREVVQGFTNLIDVGGGVLNWFLALPGPVAATTAGVAALALAAGPLSGVLAPIATGMTTLIGRSLAATSSLAAFRAAFAGLFSTIAAGAALAGGVYVISNIVAELGKVANSGDDARGVIDQLGASLGDLSNQAKLDGTNAAIEDMRNKLADAQAIADDFANQNFIERGFSGVFGNTGAGEAKDAREAVEEYTAAIEDMQDANASAEATISALGAQYGMNREQVLALADANGVDLTAGLADAQFAFGQVTDGMSDTDRTQAGLTAQTEAYTDQLSAAKSAIDEYTAALTILNGGQLSVMEAERVWAASLMAAQTALNGLDGSVLNADGNLDLYSQAGNQASETLQGMRANADQLIGTMIGQGVASTDVVAKDAQLRASFYATALQMTGSEAAANRLTDQIYGIPAERTTQINAQVGDALAGVSAVEGALARVPSVKTIRIITDTSGATVGRDFSNGTAARARGGPVTAGRTYWVGEEGPELVQFGADGFVTPADLSRRAATDAVSTLMPREMGWLPSMAGNSSSSTDARQTYINVQTVEDAGRIARVSSQALADHQYLASGRS